MTRALPARAETVRGMTVSFYIAATGPYFEKMAAEFHAANPTFDVKIDVVNWPALLQKLQTDISRGIHAAEKIKADGGDLAGYSAGRRRVRIAATLSGYWIDPRRGGIAVY